MLLKLLIRFLIPLLINAFVQINGQSMTDDEVNLLVLETLDKIGAELNRPVIPDELSEPFPDKPYFTNVWEDSPTDFYNPYGVNIYAGQKNELGLNAIYEFDVNGRITYNAAESDKLVSVLVSLHGINVLIWSTSEGIFLRQISPVSLTLPVKGATISGVLSLDYLVLKNSSTGHDEIFLFVLLEQSLVQKIVIFKVDFTLTLVFKSELTVKSGLVKVRVVDVVNARKYLVIGVRYTDVIHRISCTSDVFEVIYAPLHLIKLQDLQTSGAVDVESFTINGLTFLAVANSFCHSSDIFIFDVPSNSFDLYQRLPLKNATDLEFFSIGYRHFLASICSAEAVIYEWFGENMEFVQSFSLLPMPSLPTRDIRRWHNLRLPWKDQAILLLVRSSESIDIIKWSKWEDRFVPINDPACVSWSKLSNTVGIGATEEEYSYTDLRLSMWECIFSGIPCAGVSVVPINGEYIYIPKLSRATSDAFSVYKSRLNHQFWIKQGYTAGLSCFTSINPVIKAQITSYVIEDLVYMVIPFRDHISIAVLKSYSTRLDKSSLKSKILHRLENHEREVNLLASKLESIKSRVLPSNILTDTQEQYITRPITFDTTVTAFENLEVDKFEFYEVEGEPILEEWDDKLKLMDQKLKQLHRILQDAVPLNEAILMKDLYFKDVEVKGSLYSKGVSQVTTINQIPILEFIDNAATIQQGESISGTKSFTGKIEYLGNIKVINLIAGYHFPSDVLTTNTVQELKGVWKFDHTVNINEELHLTFINGIDLERSVTSTYVNHTVTYNAPKVFHDRIVIEGDIMVKEINGIDIGLLAQHAVSKNLDGIIAAPKIFTKSVEVTGNVEIGDTLNGFRVPFLDSVIVKTDQPATIKAPKTYAAAVTIRNHLNVRGLLNRQPFPSSFAIKNAVANIMMPKNFISPVTVQGNLIVDGLINGISVDDIATLHTDQEFPQLTKFSGGLNIHTLRLTGVIDKITIQDLQIFAKFGRPVSKPLSQLSTLTVNGNVESVNYINGLFVRDVLKDVIYKNDDDVVFTGVKTFRQSINITKVFGHFPLVNNFDLETDFLNYKTPNHVTGRKIFAQRVIFKEGLHVTGLIDNVNLTELHNTVITLDSMQEIKGVKKFVDGFELNMELQVDGLIDSVKFPHDVLLKENPKAILAQKIFHKGIRGKVIRTNVMKLGSVNNIDWKRFETTRVTLSTEQIISGRMTLLDVKIQGELKVIGKINNIDVNKLTNDAMLKSKKQTITGLKTVTGLLKVDHVKTGGRGVLSNIDLREINSQVVRVNDNAVKDIPVFHHIKTDHVVTYAKLNNIELGQFLNDAVMRGSTSVQEITGLKMFTDRITVHGNLDVIQVNGLFPSKDILSKTLPQELFAFFEFSDVTVSKNINSVDKLNKFDLPTFQRRVMKTDEDTSFHTLTLDKIVVTHNLNTTLINKIDIPVLLKQAISRRTPTKITATKTFLGSVTVDGNVHVNGQTNGIKLPVFVKDLVFTTGNHIITGNKIFLDEVRLSRQMDIKTNLNIVGSVKGIDLNRLLKKVIYTNLKQIIYGHKIFTAPLTISHNLIIEETINDISIPNDTLLLKGDQTITGTTTFERIVVEGDIKGIYTNSRVVVDEYKDTLFINTNKPVAGRKIIKNSVLFKDRVIVTGKTCGIDFSRNVMTLNSMQTITGKKLFHHIKVTGNAHVASLNGRTLALSSSLWSTVEMSSYQAHYNFHGRTEFINVELHFPTTSVSSIDYIISDLHLLSHNLTSADTIRQCFNFDVMKSLEYSPLNLEGFNYSQSLELYGNKHFEVFEIEDNVHLITRQQNPCQTASFFTLSRLGQHHEWSFVEIANSNIGTYHWTQFSHKKVQYLLASEPNPLCGVQSRILRYAGPSNAPILHCNLTNQWFRQSAVISIGDSLFAALVRSYNGTSIVQIRMEATTCAIARVVLDNLDIEFVTTLEHQGLFLFSKSYEGIWLFKVNGMGIPEKILTRKVPGLKRVVAYSSRGRQYVIIAKEVENTGLFLIQVFVVEIVQHTMYFQWVKQIEPRHEEILDVKVISRTSYDQYLAILYRQTGVSVMKLDGYGTIDKIILPLASALQMGIFQWNNQFFIALSPVGNSSRTDIYEIITKGESVRENFQCNTP